MRPDEHKKKKNSAYKKKHGIASNKSSSETASVSSDKVDKKNVDKSDRKNLQRPAPAFKEKAKSQAVPVSSDEASSDSDAQDKVPKRKQFSRREIVSNWRKYEMEPEEEEKVKAKGEKYDVLLSMAGEAMSRFRFRDELEWDDELNNEDANGIGEQQSYLQLNPTELMQSLSCIPVHQLLGVDEELFPRDQLESILQTASMNQAMYSPRQAVNSTENQSVPLTSTLCDSKTDETILHVASNHHEEETKSILVPVPSKTHSTSNEINQTFEPNTSSSSTSKSTENGEYVHKNLSEANSPKSTQALGLQDDDLDRLLDMDLDIKNIAEDNSCTSQSASVDGTDSLKASSALAVSKKDKESENLEEWLDGILD